MPPILLAWSLQYPRCESRQEQKRIQNAETNQANQQDKNFSLRSNRDDESKEYDSTDDVATTVDCSSISLGYGLP